MNKEHTTISFEKIAYNGTRKINEVTVSIELRERTTNAGFSFLELAISGDVWNSRHTDIYCGGQCLDTLKNYVHTPLFKEIYEIWNRYHLNGLHAGTPEQTDAIEKWLAEGNAYDYTKACEHLQDLDLYAVYFTGHGWDKDYNNEPYVYGTDWIIETLPEDVIKRVREIIKENNQKW